MNFHLKLNNEKLQSLNGQLAYTNEALSQKDIEAWELREFTATKCDIIKEIWETEELIERIKEIA
jgi:5'(3')-deoxyribonucleotidase